MCDDFDLKSLPSEFVSRPSEVIRKLNEKRRDLHHETIRSMREQMRSLNLEVEEEIRKESEICINKLKELREEADEFLASVNHKYESLNDFDLEEDTVKNKFRRVTETNTRQLEIVDELDEKLVSIEKNRSEMMKQIMRETKEQVQTISYKLPFKIDEFFENELVSINQITLNNHQSYAELKQELKLQVKHDMKRWSEQLLEFKEELKKLLRILAKKSVV